MKRILERKQILRDAAFGDTYPDPGARRPGLDQQAIQSWNRCLPRLSTRTLFHDLFCLAAFALFQHVARALQKKVPRPADFSPENVGSGNRPGIVLAWDGSFLSLFTQMGSLGLLVLPGGGNWDVGFGIACTENEKGPAY